MRGLFCFFLEYETVTNMISWRWASRKFAIWRVTRFAMFTLTVYLTTSVISRKSDCLIWNTTVKPKASIPNLSNLSGIKDSTFYERKSASNIIISSTIITFCTKTLESEINRLLISQESALCYLWPRRWKKAFS